MKHKKYLGAAALLLAGYMLGASSMPMMFSSADLFGDINSDGTINAKDAAKILEYSAWHGAGGKESLYNWLNGIEETQTNPNVNLPDTDDTLSIVCWTDSDLANMFDIYAQHSSGKVVYQNCGANGSEASVRYASYLNSGADIDLYVAEASWILNYINDDSYSAPLSDLDISESDYANTYPYTVEIGTNNNGVLKAASWQCAPGCYTYNADLAKECLGVTSPEEMQEKISDWDKFENTAQELYNNTKGGVKIAASMGDMWQAFSAVNDSAWVKGTTIQTDTAQKFTTMINRFVNNGYINSNVRQWTSEWSLAGQNNETLGYFYASWYLGEGSLLEQIEQNGGTNNWRVVKGPQEFYWGGSWLCVSPNCNTASEAARFVKSFTTDTKIMKEYALYSGDFVNNKVAMNEIIEKGSNANALLGGQDQFAVLADVANNIKMSDNMTKYDQDLKYIYLDVLEDNIKHSDDAIMEEFVRRAKEEYPSLTY